MKRKIFTSVFIGIVMAASAVYAQPIDTYEQSLDGEVSVSGSGLNSDVDYLIEMADKSMVTIKDDKVVNVPDSAVMYVAAGTTTGEGRYDISFRLLESIASKPVIIRYKSLGMESAYDYEAYYISPDDVETFKTSYNSAAAEKDIAALDILLRNEIYINFIYANDNLRRAYIEREASNLIGFLNGLTANGQIDSAETFKAYFNKELIWLCALSPKNESDIGAFINEMQEAGLDTTAGIFSEFAGLSNELQSKIISNIYRQVKNTPETDKDGFKKLLSDSIAVELIRNAPYYADVHTYMVKYTDTDFSAYNNLNNKSTVDKQMMGGSYSTKSELQSYFYQLVENAKNTVIQPIISGGGGGGSSSGRGGSPGGASNNIAVVIPDITQEKEAVKFEDLEDYDWAKTAIEELSAKGVVTGVSDMKYEPGRSITREEFVVMIVRAFEFASVYGTAAFEDVSSAAWYYNYIVTATKCGIINGRDKNTFGIGDNVTREEAAAICYRAMRCKDMLSQFDVEPEDFKDNDSISDYAKAAISYLSLTDVVNGYDDGSFRPKGDITRAEAAVMLNRILNLT